MSRTTVIVAAVCVTAVLGGAVGATPPDGERLYRRHCAPCHGPSGRGDGPDAEIFGTRPRDLREGFLRRYPTADLVRRIRDGAALELALDLNALRARAAEVEAVVAYMKRLPTIDWGQVEAGREVYLDRCEICHGAYGEPPRSLPPGVSRPPVLTPERVAAIGSPRALLALVRGGHGAMPALVPRLEPAEGAPLLAFLRLLSPGFATWDRTCAVCHGDDGRGGGRLAEAIDAPTVVFDAAYFRRRDPEAVRAAVWHMLTEQAPTMPHFRWTLSEGEVAAIVGYLQRTEPAAATPGARTPPAGTPSP